MMFTASFVTVAVLVMSWRFDDRVKTSKFVLIVRATTFVGTCLTLHFYITVAILSTHSIVLISVVWCVVYCSLNIIVLIISLPSVNNTVVFIIRIL